MSLSGARVEDSCDPVAVTSGQPVQVGNLSQTLAAPSPGESSFDNLSLGALSTYLHDVQRGPSSADLGNVSSALNITIGSIPDPVQLGTFAAAPEPAAALPSGLGMVFRLCGRREA